MWHISDTVGTLKVKVIRLAKIISTFSRTYLHSKFDGQCLNSFKNNQTFIIFMTKISVTLSE